MRAMLVAVVVLVTLMRFGDVVHAQDNVHEHDMERAHPTPLSNIPAPLLPYVVTVPFPSSFLNANMITVEADQLPTQNESSIAINPTNPLNLIGSAVDYRGGSASWAYYTLDGGKTWSNVTLGKVHPNWASSNDPSVCFDTDGRGYLCYGGFGTDTSKSGENGVFVSITNDGGRTWNPKHVPVIEHLGKQSKDSAFEDKYYVHVDTATASPFKGNVYIPWKRVINADSSTQIVIVKSTDRGLTWSKPVNVSSRFSRTSEDTTFGQSFPIARTGPDGSVHLVWNSGTERSVRYARSTDAGATWTAPRILHTYASFGTKSRIGTQVNSRLKGSVRAEAYPSLSIDNTNGPRRGWLYLCWAAGKVPDIFFSRSTDNGATWSTPIVVHSVLTNDQFWPWITVDPTSGDVATMYFDSRDDDENILVNTYVSLSTDGGTTWIDRRVGDGVNDLRNNPFSGRTFAGDYSGCDFRDGKVYPSWVDMRNTSVNIADNDVYTSIVNTRAPSATATFNANVMLESQTSLRLTWSEVTASSFGKLLDTATTRYHLRRDGKAIAVLPLPTVSFIDTGLTAHQLYHYSLTVVASTDSSISRMDSAYAGGSRAPGRITLENVTPISKSLRASVKVTLPNLRADTITPLVNLSMVRISADEKVFNVSVQSSDTGRTLSFDVDVNSAGWFHFSARAVDADGYAGESSDTIIAYVGPPAGEEPMLTEIFDTLPRYWVRHGLWGRSLSFGHSGNTSYTESPSGPYVRNTMDTVILYPYRIAIPASAEFEPRLSWFVAAFLDRLDTAYLDISTSGLGGPWTNVAWWNASKEERWNDTTKGDDAWRYGYYKPTAVEFHARLRFKSNLSKESDGFYIDDISGVAAITSVDDASNSPIATAPYPNPSTSYAVFGLLKEREVQNITVTNLAGVEMDAAWQQYGRTVVLDVRALSPGIYAVTLASGVHTSTSLLRVVR